MITRRTFVLGSGLGVVLVGCRKSNDALQCTDVTSLSKEEAAARKRTGYADRTTDPERSCDKCVQYIEPKADHCGECKLLKGPVHPSGTCRLFAKRE